MKLIAGTKVLLTTDVERSKHIKRVTLSWS